MPTEHPDEFVRTFVIAAHSDLEKVKAVLAEHPDLLNVNYQWGENNFETPLGAASHMGDRTIAEYLLELGAPLTICTAAMLGDATAVHRFLDADPAAATAVGAHNLPLLLHVALGGSPEIAQMVVDHGGGQAGPMRILLHVAAARGDEGLARWAIEQGVDVDAKNHEGKTALELAQDGGHAQVVALLEAHTANRSS